jgi:oligosaccharide repeat unit polymerase
MIMIESLLFLTIFTVLPVFWLKFMKHANISMFKVSLPSILIGFIIIFQYLGLPILFFRLDDYRSLFVTNIDIVWQVFGFSSLTITLLILGFVVACQKLGALHKFNQYNSFQREIFPAGNAQKLLILFFLLIASSVFCFYIKEVGLKNLAFLASIGLVDSDLSSSALRSLIGSDFSGKYHWYRLFMRDLMSLAAFATFAVYLLRSTTLNLIVFVYAFLISSFSMLAASEKAPFIWLLIGFFLTYSIVKFSGRIKIKFILFLAAILMIVLGVMYSYFMNTENVLVGIQRGLFSRALTGQIQPLYHYIELFPSHFNYLYGRSFPNPGGILPFENFPLTREVMAAVNPQLAERGIVGSMPTFFWGEMYANFGYLGILIPPVFVGIFVYWFNVVLFRLRMTPLTIAFFVWSIMHFQRLAFTGLSGFIVNFTLAIIGFMFISGLFLLGRGAIKMRRSGMNRLRY